MKIINILINILKVREIVNNYIVFIDFNTFWGHFDPTANL